MRDAKPWIGEAVLARAEGEYDLTYHGTLSRVLVTLNVVKSGACPLSSYLGIPGRAFCYDFWCDSTVGTLLKND